MNRKWTIEVIADFKEKGKNDAIDFQVRKAGANLQAALYLIMDGIKPQVVAFSDDFFSGRSDFDLLLQDIEGAKVPDREPDTFSDDFMESLGKKVSSPCPRGWGCQEGMLCMAMVILRDAERANLGMTWGAKASNAEWTAYYTWKEKWHAIAKREYGVSCRERNHRTGDDDRA